MKKILFLVGPHASGKTFSSREYINNKTDYDLIDTGPIMRRLHDQSKSKLSICEWVKELEKFYGEDITSEMISKEINNIIINSECNNFIIIGFRTLNGINYIIERLEIENYSILYIDASYELLYSNYLSREKQTILFDEFNEYLNNEQKNGLAQLKEIALSDSQLVDYHFRTSNNDNIEECFERHFKVYKKLVREKK